MLALYRAGRQADALEAYQRARRLLPAELGLDPSEQLTRLQQRILERRPDADALGAALDGRARRRRQSSLPRPLTRLVGREREVLGAGADGRPGRPSYHADRPGGVGKTRLLLELAGAGAGYADGAVFVRLER